MPRVSVDVQGSDRLQALFEKASGAGKERVLAQAMTGEANRILNESKRIVPFRDGILKKSGEVSKPKLGPNNIELEITYGGAAQAYAEVQHWDTSLNHPNGKQALYLLTPVEAARDEFVRKVKERFITYVRRSS